MENSEVERRTASTETDFIEARKNLIETLNNPIGSRKDQIGLQTDQIGSRKDQIESSKDQITSRKDHIDIHTDRIDVLSNRIESRDNENDFQMDSSRTKGISNETNTSSTEPRENDINSKNAILERSIPEEIRGFESLTPTPQGDFTSDVLLSPDKKNEDSDGQNLLGSILADELLLKDVYMGCAPLVGSENTSQVYYQNRNSMEGRVNGEEFGLGSLDLFGGEMRVKAHLEEMRRKIDRCMSSNEDGNM